MGRRHWCRPGQPQLAANGSTMRLLWVDTPLADADSAIFERQWNASTQHFVEALPGQASAGGISATGGDAQQLAVAIDDAGRAVLAWTDRSVGGATASPEVLVRADWSGQRLSLSVLDQGAGFSAEILSRLQQTAEHGRAADPSRGLVLTLYTLDRLGGALLLRNREEGGAHAEIQLPLHAIALAEPRLAA